MPIPDAYLLVEGKDDLHVVAHLWKEYNLPQAFAIETPKVELLNNDADGIDALLEGLSIRLWAENLQVLGIIVDADQNLANRWASVCNHLVKRGYSDIPPLPVPDGWVSTADGLPRVGVWLMPNNQVKGILEDFAEKLIPAEDQLRPKATYILDQIQSERLNRYKDIDRSKALIHTWLAWQKRPGMPMGQAITAHALRHDSPIALMFIAWLKRLFEIP